MLNLFKSRPRPVPPEPLTLHRFSGPTMGTTWTVACGLPEDATDLPLDLMIQAAVGQVDDHMSTWKPDSPLSRFNRTDPGDWVAVPADLAFVVHSALAISRDTGGAFDVTVGGAVDLWGFGPKGGTGTVPQGQAVVGYQHLQARLDPPALRKTARVSVDLSGIAKGYGVDQIARVLMSCGIDRFLVTLDGEARARGVRPDGQPWTLAIEAPIPGGREAWDILTLRGGSVATSGDYRHFFQADGHSYSHTIDAATGAPVDSPIVSVTVLRDDCMMADAWATALTVMGPEKGMAMAEARHIPALFLLRSKDGLIDLPSPTFRQLWD